MSDFIGVGAMMLVVLSPLLRRLYIERFWTHARGTVIRLGGAISTNPGAAGTWVWAPIIEYYAGKQRFSSKVSYWQRFNAKSKYSVGDQVEILYDPRDPSRVMLNSWAGHLLFTMLIGAFVAERLVDGQ